MSIFRGKKCKYIIHICNILLIYRYRRSATTKSSSSRCWMNPIQSPSQEEGVGVEQEVELVEWQVTCLVGVTWDTSRLHHRRRRLLRGWGGAQHCHLPSQFEVHKCKNVTQICWCRPDPLSFFGLSLVNMKRRSVFTSLSIVWLIYNLSLTAAKSLGISRGTCYTSLLCLWEEWEPGCQLPFTTELRWRLKKASSISPFFFFFFCLILNKCLKQNFYISTEVFFTTPAVTFFNTGSLLVGVQGKVAIWKSLDIDLKGGDIKVQLLCIGDHLCAFDFFNTEDMILLFFFK